jgi:hypothetical protein
VTFFLFVFVLHVEEYIKTFFVVYFIVSPADEPRPMVWEVVEQTQVIQKLCIFPETQLSLWFCAFFV